MTLVQVKAALHGDGRYALERAGDQHALVTLDRRRVKARYLVERNPHGRFHLICQRAEAGSQHEHDLRLRLNVRLQIRGRLFYIFTHAAGLPSAAGGVDRPTMPANATIVRIYGIISTNCDGRISADCNRICAVSAAAKSRHANPARSGSQRPKITAANAMNPRPAVISSLNWCWSSAR